MSRWEDALHEIQARRSAGILTKDKTDRTDKTISGCADGGASTNSWVLSVAASGGTDKTSAISHSETNGLGVSSVLSVLSKGVGDETDAQGVLSVRAEVLSVGPASKHTPSRQEPPPSAATPSRDEGDPFRHGRSLAGNPVTWTGKIVSLEEWRRLTDWQRYGPDGRLYCALCRDWVRPPHTHGENE